MLARDLGKVDYFNESEARGLLELKKKLGFDDPRFHVEDCDLCGNSAFRDGYKESAPQQNAFETAPSFPGYLQSPSSSNGTSDVNREQLVQTITEQVMASLASAT